MTYRRARCVPALFVAVVLLMAGCHNSSDANRRGTGVTPDSGLRNVVAVSASGRQTFALSSTGTVLAWGWNDGRLMCGLPPGRNERAGAVLREDGSELDGIAAISAGENFVLSLGRDGTALGWGGNNSGQLGQGNRDAQPFPVTVKGSGGEGVLTGLVAVAAGRFHAAALRKDGSVWTWGRGREGQLGTTDKPSNQTTPVQVCGQDGQGKLQGIRAIAAGRYHTLALDSSGTVWSWGHNKHGQLGDGSKENRNTPVRVVGPNGEGALTGIVAIAASSGRVYISVALDADGRVWSWGQNNAGLLGDGSTERERSWPGLVAGPAGEGTLNGIAAIAAGGSHILTLAQDGQVWAWGENRFGQLGDGTTISRAFPVMVNLPGEQFTGISGALSHSVALRTDGSVAAWGNDWYGQLGAQAVAIAEQVQPPGRYGDDCVLWTTARRLMPQWGFYPNAQAYGSVKPLDTAAWTLGKNNMVWVPEIPAAGRYHLWVRSVYGQIKATIDEQPLSGAGLTGFGGAYAWRKLGHSDLEAGSHHVDLLIFGQCMFDAVLLTTSETMNPNEVDLPDPVEQPRVSVPRRYRDDSHLRELAGGKPFVVGKINRYDTSQLNDWLPATNDLLRAPLRIWGAANQYVGGGFGVRALEDIAEIEITLTSLDGEQNTTIGAETIDLRVAHVRERAQSLFSWPTPKRPTAELLLRDERAAEKMPPAGHQGGFGGGVCRTAIPGGESRQIWITVQVPAGMPAGICSGDIILKTGKTTHRQKLELEILPLELLPVEGYYSIYHRAIPSMESSSGVSEQRYRAELEDMVRHGLNSVTLYGGFDTLHYPQEAGMTESPCIMSWPGGSGSLKQVETARAMGFPDLLYYGVDEPTTDEAIARCRREAERRRKIGLKTLTAISVPRKAWEGLRDVIEYPVLINNTYGSKETAYARELGHCPISYWMTSSTFPVWFRAYAGIYNSACGFLGTMPWSYSDSVEPMRQYDPDAVSHQVTFPDANGLPIPTIQWEAYREGIDDVRYLQALDRAIAAGEAVLAQTSANKELEAALAKAGGIRKRHFESAGENLWYRYFIKTQSAELDDARRAFAVAIIDISVHLVEAP